MTYYCLSNKKDFINAGDDPELVEQLQQAISRIQQAEKALEQASGAATRIDQLIANKRARRMGITPTSKEGVIFLFYQLWNDGVTAYGQRLSKNGKQFGDIGVKAMYQGEYPCRQ